MNKLLQLYSDMLTAMGLVVEPDGDIYISTRSGSGKEVLKPLTIELNDRTRRVVLPTKKKDNEENYVDDAIPFHPACESILLDASPIIKMLERIIAIRIYKVTQNVAIHLLRAAADPKIIPTLSNRQSELIGGFSGASEATMVYLTKVIKKCSGIDGDHPLVNVQLSYKGEVNGEPMRRTVRLIKYILEDDAIADMGVQGSQKSQNMVYELYRTVLPSFSVTGSNSESTPNLDSLVGLFINWAGHINKIKSTMGKVLGSSLETIDVSWANEYDNLYDYYDKLLPVSFEGNDGGSKVGASKPEPVEIPEMVEPSYDVSVKTTPQQSQPVQQVNASTSYSTHEGPAERFARIKEEERLRLEAMERQREQQMRNGNFNSGPAPTSGTDLIGSLRDGLHRSEYTQSMGMGMGGYGGPQMGGYGQQPMIRSNMTEREIYDLKRQHGYM